MYYNKKMINRCLICIHAYVKSFILFTVFRLCHFEFFLFVFVSIIELTYNYRKHFFYQDVPQQ